MTRSRTKKLQNLIDLPFNMSLMPIFTVHVYCTILDNFLDGPPPKLKLSFSEFNVITFHKDNKKI